MRAEELNLRVWAKTIRRAAIGAAAAAFALTAVPVHGQVIVNDTWNDGTRTDPLPPVYSERGVDADVDGDLESAWLQGGDGTLDPVGAGGPLRGQFTSPTGTSSASWTTYFTPEANPITLAQQETMRITWVFTPTNVNVSNTSQGFRLAVVDTPDGSRVESGAPADGAYTGYGMFMNMGQTLGHSSSFRLMERNIASGNLLSSSGNWTAIGVTGATNGNDGYDSGAEYTLTMEFTRTLADELAITARMSGVGLDGDGLAEVQFTDTTPHGGSFTFDTFALRPSSALITAEIFDTSLFRVEHVVVPEPASLAVLGLGGLALLRRRAR